MEGSEVSQNYTRLTLLLNEGNRALREIFKSQYKELTGADWKDGEESAQHFINTIGSSYFESAPPTQKKFLREGNLNSWDLTMLFSALSAYLIYSRKKNNQLNQNQIELRKKMSQLKEVRDKLVQLGGKFVLKEDYPNLWKSLASTVISLGVDQEDVEKIRTSSNIAGKEFQTLESTKPENCRSISNDNNPIMEDLEGFQNYLRLTLLLNEGNQVLRETFQTRYKELTETDWKDGEESAQHFIDTIGRTYFKNAQPIQKQLIKEGNLNSWDLTMLSNILSSVEQLDSRKKYDYQNQSEQRKTLSQLKEIRNKLAHLGGKSVSKEDYSNKWKILASTVISLGVDPEHVEKIRTSSNIAGIEFQNLGSTNPENTKKALALKKQGNSFVSKGEWTKSIEVYTKALELFGVSDSERGVLYSNRSHSWLKLSQRTNKVGETSSDDENKDNLSRALDDAKKSIDLRPNWWKGYSRAAQVYQQQQQWEFAILFYNQALALAPESSTMQIQTVRDDCQIQLRNAEEADQKTIETKIDKNSQLMNPKRIKLHQVYRLHIRKVLNVYKNPILVHTSNAPSKEQKNPLKLSSLKEIKFSQVSEGMDKVYSGFVINLTVIDDPIMRLHPSVHTMCRDDNWDVKLCAFYNVDDNSRVTKFVFGSKLSVLNPYFRQGTYGHHALRVDDPNSIVFQGCLDQDDGEGRICRFCWTAGAQLKCARCRRVFYCNKECQTADWQLLNHKLVCDPSLLLKL